MNNKPKLRELGKSGISVSSMTVGCWPFGGGDYWGEQSQSDVDSVVHAALYMGANTFDTAEMYNDGESERSLGKALKGRRNEAVVISKISPSNCHEVRKHCIESLKRLNTDYLDVYMLHWPINKLAIEHFTSDKSIIAAPPTVEEAYAQLDLLKKEGLIRSIGMSNFGRTQTGEVFPFYGQGLQEANDLRQPDRESRQLYPDAYRFRYQHKRAGRSLRHHERTFHKAFQERHAMHTFAIHQPEED
jgi:aryl-alcohol dehydrogenase-like predicted oxidoreductase